MARSRTTAIESEQIDHITVTPVNTNSSDSNGPISRWLRSMWRPLSAVTYLSICIFDFIVAPYLIQAQPHDLVEIFRYVGQRAVTTVVLHGQAADIHIADRFNRGLIWFLQADHVHAISPV